MTPAYIPVELRRLVCADAAGRCGYCHTAEALINRALFSDYCLKQRLTDPKITPEWAEDVRPVGRAVYDHLVTAQREYTRKSEQASVASSMSRCFSQMLHIRNKAAHDEVLTRNEAQAIRAWALGILGLV